MTYLRIDITNPPHPSSNYVLLTHGVVDRMSRLKKMRLASYYPRMAFAESTSLKLPPHGLRVNISNGYFPRLHGVRLTTAYPRTALITSFSCRSALALTKTYHRIDSTTGLC